LQSDVEILVEFIHGSAFSEQHVEEALAIDRLYYGQEDLASLGTCISWRKKNAEIYSGIVEKSSGRLLGDINIMPISDQTLSLLMTPAFHDVNLPVEQILTYSIHAQFLGYFASAARLKNHKVFEKQPKSSLMKQLFREKLRDLESKEFHIASLWTNPITESGVRFAKDIGMKSQANSVLWMMDVR
jgi:hypothetical protein